MAGRRPDGLALVQFKWLSTTPLVYQLKVQAAAHSFTSSMVQPINSFGKNVNPPGAPNASPRYLPKSTIWGFNARDRQEAGEQVFPGPRINAEYGRASLVRFENHLQPENDDGNDPMDFGSPSRTFLTHLHNGHTAPESDGQPHYSYYRFAPTTASRTTRPGSRVSGWIRCTSATRPAATSGRSSRSSGSTTTSTASPARTSTRAWSA